MSGNDQALAAITLSRLPGVGARRFRQLMEKFGDPRPALAHQQQLLAGRQLVLPGFSLAKSPTEQGIEAARRYLDDGGTVTFVGEAGYPPALLAISEPPPVLFFRGALPTQPAVAVVGTRKPCPEAETMTRAVTDLLLGQGFVTISGGAKGIDTVCHQATLGGHGCTVAVFGTGIDVSYPRENADLFRAISATGALVTELLPGTPPRRDFFPTRNRIVAGWAVATIVIQAGAKSGALITARFAAKFGKPVLVYRPPPDGSPGWEGNHELLSGGMPGFGDPASLLPHLTGRITPPIAREGAKGYTGRNRGAR